MIVFNSDIFCHRFFKSLIIIKIIIIIAGSIEDIALLNEAGFKAVFSTTPYPVSIEKAMEPNFAKENITHVLRQISKILIS